jgi:hypothetical protein
MRTRKWFWTPERLERLRSSLNAVAEHDSEGAYFGRVGLQSHVSWHGSRYGLDNVSHSVAANGLAILTFLGVLAPGKRGTKKPGYKRRYYPDRPPITEADINRFRQSRGVNSELPPAR